MSERGSYVTQFIYCKACFAVMKQVLGDWGGEIHWSRRAKNVGGIISGRISGLYPGEEIDMMRMHMEDNHPALCHEVRMAVVGEVGSAIIRIDQAGAFLCRVDESRDDV